MASKQQPAEAGQLPKGAVLGKSLIAGQWVSGDTTFVVQDRYSQETVADVAVATREQVGEAVRVARVGFPDAPPPYDRAKILLEAARRIEARRDDFVALMVAEAGFTVDDAKGEISRGLDTLTLSAEEAKRISGEMIPLDGNPGQHNRLGFTIRVPVGVVCAITPFNSPFNAVLHKIAPALAAGNAVIVKPSPYTPLTAALLCELLLDAGVPDSLIGLVNGGAEVGSWLLEEQGINFYSFTGSTKVGRIVQAGAGLRRTQLELGSIAATIVCADADLHSAMPKIARAAFRKAGQVCTSVQRLYVERSVAHEVRERLIELASAMRMGDPRDPAVQLGPMISEADAVRAESWVAEALEAGARLDHGGTRTGSLLAPTILSDVRRGMKVLDQEIFAPVVCLLPVDSLEAAIDDINATPFGLAAGVFTRDLAKAMAAARHIAVGGLHVNETSSSRVDAMPYGGVKESGFGREGPRFAIREMTEEKLITISL